MSLSLAGSMETLARLLETCGPLEPLRLSLSARDVQAEVCASATKTLERLAEVTGTDTDTSYGGVRLTADLDGGLVLVTGISPAHDPGPPGRATSTQAAVELLHSLASWAGGLDQELLHSAELWVEDHGHAFTVRLLTTAGQSDTLDTVAAAAGRGLARFRTWRTDSGLDGAGRLPCGRSVQIGVVCLD